MVSLIRFLLISALCFTFTPVQAQYVPRDERGEREAERRAIVDANEVALSVFNFGLSGGVGEVRGNWPKGSDDFYLADLQLIVGAEVEDDNGKTVQIVATSRSPRPGSDGPPGQAGVFWGFEAVPSYQSATSERWARSDDPTTWPALWPDRLDDANDPGWPGAWNGILGKDAFIDGVEHYSHYADNADQEFDYTPDPEDPERGGLGLVVSQRILAWSNTLIEDGLVFVYDIYNASPKPLDTAALGFVVGTLAGGDTDTQDDLVAHDFGRDVAYWLDFDNSGNQNQPVGTAGLALLQTPTPIPGGTPQDEIGMTGVFAFPPSDVRMNNDELLFDIITRAGANDEYINQCEADGGCDADMIVSAGPFSLPAFSSQRVIAGLVFGENQKETGDLIDVLRLFVREFTVATEDDGVGPSPLRLDAPFPNPTRSTTTVAYEIGQPGPVRLAVYDVLGREVAVLFDDVQGLGAHTVQLETRGLAHGVYLIRLDAGDRTTFRRMTVVG